MKVGDYVRVQWLDSGRRMPGSTRQEALAVDFVRPFAYGQVMHYDETHLLLAHEIDDDGVNGDFGLIWSESIVKAEVLTPAAEGSSTAADLFVPEEIDRRGSATATQVTPKG